MIDLTQTPQRLKLSILNYALSGKLTKQLPTDGTADDVLRPILQKKYELLKDKKIRKHKRLPSVKETPFKIPNNWTWIHFSSLYDMVGGSQPPKATFITHPADKYIRLYQTRDYGPNPKPVYIPKNKARKITNKGDILVARYGGSLGEIFRADHGAYNVALAKVTPIILRKELDTGYIWYYLKSDFYQRFVRTLNKSAQAGFNKKDLLKLIIPVPPLAEQKRIVQRLDQILPRIDGLNKDVVKLHSIRKAFPHRLKQSLLMEAMQGKLTKQLPSDGNASDLINFVHDKKVKLIKNGKLRKRRKLPPLNKGKIPFNIPNNWKWVRLGYIFDISSASRVHKSEWKSSGIPFYRAREVVSLSKNKPLKDPIFISKKTYQDKISRSGKPCKDDMLFTGVGTLGTSWIVPNNNKFYYKDASVLCLHNISDININYINMFFKSSLFHDQVKKGSRGTAVKTLTITNSSKLIIPLPPLAEQKRIIIRLNKLFSLF